MTRILLVRHGLSEWNATGRWQGWADVALSDVGARQAADAARSVGTVDAIVASDLQRAVQTAEIIAESIGVGPVGIDPGLRERGAGEWEGLTRSEILERDPHAFATAPVDPPGGEPVEAVLERGVAALHRIVERFPGADVLAVTHGGLIRHIERHLGVEPQPVPNLAGRQVVFDAGRFHLGERLLLIDPDETPVTVPQQL